MLNTSPKTALGHMLILILILILILCWPASRRSSRNIRGESFPNELRNLHRHAGFRRNSGRRQQVLVQSPRYGTGETSGGLVTSSVSSCQFRYTSPFCSPEKRRGPNISTDTNFPSRFASISSRSEACHVCCPQERGGRWSCALYIRFAGPVLGGIVAIAPTLSNVCCQSHVRADSRPSVRRPWLN